MAIRVGRIVYDHKGKATHPSYPGFTPVVVMTPSSEYGSLSPYELRDAHGRNLECIWQGAKIYPRVPQSIQTYSRYDRRVIWQHPGETHVVKKPITASDAESKYPEEKDVVVPTPEYWQWRHKLMNNRDAVRYPVGFHGRHDCIGAIWDSSVHPAAPDAPLTYSPVPLLGYVDARKAIYLPIYNQLVIHKPQFHDLATRFARGERLLVLEVDGPHQEGLPYYRQKYGVGGDFIEKGTMLATRENLTLMLNDEKYSYGHGYCLGWALQGFPLP